MVEASAQVFSSSLRAHLYPDLDVCLVLSVSLVIPIACWVSFIMADGDEESEEDGEVSFKKPLELFEQKKIVRICAPMVRYSK